MKHITPGVVLQTEASTEFWVTRWAEELPWLLTNVPVGLVGVTLLEPDEAGGVDEDCVGALFDESVVGEKEPEFFGVLEGAADLPAAVALVLMVAGL
jgi:hypothetical protein